MINLKTTSTSQLVSNVVLNQFEREHPEYRTILSFLSFYPLQVWANESRKIIQMDIESLEEAILENGEYFGIKNVYHDSLGYQKKSLKITNEILLFFDKMLNDESLTKAEKKVIDSIFITGAKTNSKAIRNYLEKALLKLFPKYNDEFMKYANELNSVSADLDIETLIAYHDIEILFKLVGLLNSLNFKTMDINKKDVYQIMCEAINLLDDYPFDEDVKKIMAYSFVGMNHKQVALKIGRHRDYVEVRYRKGLEALECIFWGYASSDRSIY